MKYFDNMDRAWVYYGKWSKSEKDKNYVISLMWNIKQKRGTNKLTKQEETPGQQNGD